MGSAKHQYTLTYLGILHHEEIPPCMLGNGSTSFSPLGPVGTCARRLSLQQKQGDLADFTQKRGADFKK